MVPCSSAVLANRASVCQPGDTGKTLAVHQCSSVPHCTVLSCTVLYCTCCTDCIVLGFATACRYLYSSDNAVVAGALLAIGLVNCGVQNENDPGRCTHPETGSGVERQQ